VTRRRAAAGGLLLLLAAAGCGVAPSPRPAGPVPDTVSLARTELVFGRRRPDGGIVTDAEWGAFVAEHVTPRFPNGFTVLDATGQYRDRAGRIVTEPTKILLIVHPPDAPVRAALQALRDVYRRLFDQDSVLLISAPAEAGF
jgi:hypothetical protein